MSEKQERHFVSLRGGDDEANNQQDSEMRQQPREENMELAAKLVILEDEKEEPNSYEEELMIVKRQQELKKQHAREESTFPPSVIAIPEWDEDEAADGDELDSISRSIPFVLAALVQENPGISAKALDQHFQQITEMLVDLQNQQYEALSKQHAFHAEPTASLTQSSLDADDSSKKSGKTRRAGIDPPASHAVDRSVEERKPPYRPDPPAMQVLIGDVLKKLNPSGEIQSNDLSNWVLESLNPATRPSPRESVAAMSQGPDVSSSELDSKLPSWPTKPPPGQQTMPNPWKQLLSLDAPDLDSMIPAQITANDAVVQNFEEKWEDAVHLIQSVVEAPSQGPPGGPVNQVAGTLNASHVREPGAIRVTRVAARTGAPPPPGVVGEMAEQKPVSALLDPVEAQVVDEDQEMDRDLQLRKLNEAVVSLQQKQLEMMEARVVRAEPVIEEDNDDRPSFFETHGFTMLMMCLAVGVGFLVGLRTR